jgi:hypothetical protein
MLLQSKDLIQLIQGCCKLKTVGMSRVMRSYRCLSVTVQKWRSTHSKVKKP